MTIFIHLHIAFPPPPRSQSFLVVVPHALYPRSSCEKNADSPLSGEMNKKWESAVSLSSVSESILHYNKKLKSSSSGYYIDLYIHTYNTSTTHASFFSLCRYYSIAFFAHLYLHSLRSSPFIAAQRPPAPAAGTRLARRNCRPAQTKPARFLRPVCCLVLDSLPQLLLLTMSMMMVWW